jgi:uncharacterized protein YjiS (DUF1127 family)
MARTMMSSSTMPYATARDASAFRSFGDAMMRVVDTLLIWHERTRQRRLLAAAENEILRDIGIGRAEIAAETDKPFWRG